MPGLDASYWYTGELKNETLTSAPAYRLINTAATIISVFMKPPCKV